MNAYDYMKICTQIFIAALFVIDKNWKQSKCALTGKSPKCASTGKHLALSPYNGILLSNKKEWTIDTCNNVFYSQLQ